MQHILFSRFFHVDFRALTLFVEVLRCGVMLLGHDALFSSRDQWNRLCIKLFFLCKIKRPIFITYMTYVFKTSEEHILFEKLVICPAYCLSFTLRIKPLFVRLVLRFFPEAHIMPDDLFFFS